MTVKRTTIELDEDLVRAAQAVTGDASDGRARAAAAGGRGCRAGRRAPRRIVDHLAHAGTHVDADVLLSEQAWR